MKNLAKTTLPITYIGIMPYVKHNPFGGSESLVIKILAEQFGFLTKFVPERAFDVRNGLQVTGGMVYRVILIWDYIVSKCLQVLFYYT